MLHATPAFVPWILLLTGIACGQAPPTLTMSAATPAGTAHAVILDAGIPFAPYVFDLGLAGTSPGTPLGGGPVLPLNRPFVYLDLFGGSPAYAGIFSGFTGTTDAQGIGRPVFHVPPLEALAGTPVAASFVTSDGASLLIGPSAGFTLLRPAGVGPASAPPLPVAAPSGAPTRFVSPAGNDSWDGLTPATAWRQISHAASQVGPGDIVEIANGTYAGPVLIRNVAGTESAPLIFRATGGAAVLTGSGNTNNDDRNGIFIGASRWVTVHGLRVLGSLRAGVRVSLSDHVTIQACVFGSHQKWGIFTDYADDLRVLGNECYGSVDEHGIYLSNSGDRSVVAGNWCHDNRLSGIQINADPHFLAPIGGYVPDGISSECVVERNLCTENGAAGAAGINLASVRRSTIRNNVVASTVQPNNTGIALWDDGNGSVWGCKDNLIEHNTIAFGPGVGRYAVSLLNGSTGNQLRNNVLQGGRRGALSFSADSLTGLGSDANVLHSVDGWPIIVRDDSVWQPYTLAQWQGLGHDPGSIHASPSFVAPGNHDWSLAPASPGRDAAVRSLPTIDLRGVARPVGAASDRGAYEN